MLATGQLSLPHIKTINNEISKLKQKLLSIRNLKNSQESTKSIWFLAWLSWLSYSLTPATSAGPYSPGASRHHVVRVVIDGYTVSSDSATFTYVAWLSWLSYSCELITVLSVCMVCVWMLTRMAQIITAAHRDLWSCLHRPTYKLWSHTEN